MARGYRKRIKIAKGVHLNVSKSGLGLSLGGHGLSVSMGKNGTYLNTSIPGTGLYSRTKLGGSAASQRNQNTAPQTHLKVDYAVGNDGAIHFYSEQGDEILDPELITYIKRQKEYKEILPQLKQAQAAKGEALRAEAASATANFTEIYRLAPPVLSKAKAIRYAENQLNKLAPERYLKKQWTIPQPTQFEVQQQLEAQAEEQFPGLFKKKKRATYVEKHLAAALQDAITAWTEQRQRFEAQESKKEQEQNAYYDHAYAARREELQRYLSDDDGVILERVEQWLSTLELPLEMHADIEMDKSVLFIDLDLPEIEDLPQDYVKILKSGKPSVKNKTQKQLKQEYVQCVFGLTEFMAASIFNLNATLEDIAISGYTQRRDKNGDIKDDYIYSAVIIRETLASMMQGGKQIENPVETFLEFPNRMKLSTANTFSKIKPFTEEEVFTILAE